MERHEIEKLANAVRDHLGSNSDLVAAAAAVALITSHPAAPRLATELLRSDNARARAIVVTGIANKVGRIAHGDIVPALDDSAPAVRRAAVDALGRWKNKKDRPLLLARVHKDADGQVRSRALRALLRVGGADLAGVAIRSLGDSYLGARISAVALLDEHGDATAVEELQKVAASTDFPVALRAAVALYKRDQRNMQAVLDNAFASPDWMTRSAALNAAADAAGEQAALSLARKGLADKRAEVRLTAARLLLRLGDKDAALDTLREALSADQLSPRLLAAADLARRGEQDAIALLSRMARTGPADRRESAIAAHRAADVVSDGLVAALGDSSIAVRLAAADVLLSL